MKKIISILVYILVVSNIFATDKDYLADSAQNCFMQSDYTQALVYYDSIRSMGFSSSDLYYNIGNCYYRLSDYPNAIYYYEKSLYRNPKNEDARLNLQIANQFLKQKLEPLQVPFYVSWGEAILHLFSSDAWSILSIVMFVLVLSGIAIWLFNRKLVLQKLGFVLSVFSLLIFVCSVVCAYKSANEIENNGMAVIMKQSMVKTTPNVEALNSFEVCEGLKVEIIDSANNKLNIRLQDGKEGWINKNDVKLLSE